MFSKAQSYHKSRHRNEQFLCKINLSLSSFRRKYAYININSLLISYCLQFRGFQFFKLIQYHKINWSFSIFLVNVIVIPTLLLLYKQPHNIIIFISLSLYWLFFPLQFLKKQIRFLKSALLLVVIYVIYSTNLS